MEPDNNPLSEKIDNKEKLLSILRNRTRHNKKDTLIIGNGLRGITTYFFRETKRNYGHITDTSFHIWRDELRNYTGYYDILQVRDFVSYFSSCTHSHSLHPSKQKGLVAFVENEEKAKRDVCTVMKFSKYLTKFFPDLGNEQIKKANAKFEYLYGEPPKVLFSEKEEDFIRVINEGPSSCMSEMSYKGHIHPAAVYASGDIQIAWITDGQRITARTLCNKTESTHVRTYGDGDKLNKLLSNLGYIQTENALVDCKIKAIENRSGGGHIMPYIDAGIGSGGGSLDYEYFNEDYFVLVPAGNASSTYCGYENHGRTYKQEEDCYCYCGECGDPIESENDAYYIENHDHVCEYCRDQSYSYAQIDARYRTMEYVHNDYCTYVECLDKYIHNDILNDLDLIYDENRCEWLGLDDCEQCIINENYFYREDMEKCGENGYGEALWIHKTEIVAAVNQNYLIKDEDGNIFWHESIEGQEILEKEKHLELDLNTTHYEETNT